MTYSFGPSERSQFSHRCLFSHIKRPTVGLHFMRGLQSRGYIAECFRLFHAKDGSKHVTLRTSVPFRGLIDIGSFKFLEPNLRN